jgi:hypothetical protein
MLTITAIDASQKVALSLPTDLGLLLRYEPETGKLFWLPRPVTMFLDSARSADISARSWNTRYAGKEAFTAANNHGYLHGTLFGKHEQAHRVVWALSHGEWPAGEIDHIDGDRKNNRLANLRDVTPAENRKNQTRSVKNTSGVTGVHWCTTWNRWIAKVMVNRKTKTIGNFATFEEAVAARAEASRQLGFAAGHGKEGDQS